jgi:hypothetical protein
VAAVGVDEPFNAADDVCLAVNDELAVDVRLGMLVVVTDLEMVTLARLAEYELEPGQFRSPPVRPGATARSARGVRTRSL